MRDAPLSPIVNQIEPTIKSLMTDRKYFVVFSVIRGHLKAITKNSYNFGSDIKQNDNNQTTVSYNLQLNRTITIKQWLVIIFNLYSLALEDCISIIL